MAMIVNMDNFGSNDNLRSQLPNGPVHYSLLQTMSVSVCDDIGTCDTDGSGIYDGMTVDCECDDDNCGDIETVDCDEVDGGDN